MAMRKNIKGQRKKQRRVVGECYFCKSKLEPSYLEPEVLNRYLTERGKVLSAKRTGICAKHQRSLRQQILRARYLALVPYVRK